MDYATAKNKLILGDFSNSDWFEAHGYFLEQAYSLVLEQRAEEALSVLDIIYEKDIRADWLRKIIPVLVSKKFEEYPSFLQVRNFLEVDLTMFLQMEQGEYTLNLLNFGEEFFSICKESYKFMGRALYYYGLKPLALKFFLFAKDKFYNDSEVHFLLAKTYLDMEDKENARHAIQTCLSFIPEYKPALKILSEI